jgi:hypothetical protein
MILAPTCEVLALAFHNCRAGMRIIAFIAHQATIERILLHLGAPTEPPPTGPARAPSLLTR